MFVPLKELIHMELMEFKFPKETNFRFIDRDSLLTRSQSERTRMVEPPKM